MGFSPHLKDNLALVSVYVHLSEAFYF